MNGIYESMPFFLSFEIFSEIAFKQYNMFENYWDKRNDDTSWIENFNRTLTKISIQWMEFYYNMQPYSWQGL